MIVYYPCAGHCGGSSKVRTRGGLCGECEVADRVEGAMLDQATAHLAEVRKLRAQKRVLNAQVKHLEAASSYHFASMHPAPERTAEQQERWRLEREADLHRTYDRWQELRASYRRRYRKGG